MNTERFPDVMIDIETFDTEPSAVILSIGAIAFNRKTGERANESFYIKLDVDKQVEAGRTISFSTIKWWYDQDKDMLTEALSGDILVDIAIDKLNTYIENKCCPDVMVWAKSPAFDCTILKNAAKGERYVSWSGKNERDVRTYLLDYPFVFSHLKPTHHPVQDALIQIEQVCAVYVIANK